tara:strand:+ start:526 stop:738 length:213 start_codon:yes stop_codon:yes gene_type:complete
MKEEIEQIRKESNNKIYYIIFDDHKRVEEEIIANFNMGLISFIEKLKQIKELNEFTLKKFKSNGITDYIH